MAFARKTFSFIFIFIHIIFAPSSAAKARSVSSSVVRTRSAGPVASTKNEKLPTEGHAGGKGNKVFPLPNTDRGRMLDSPTDVVGYVTKKMEETKTMVTEFSASLKKRNANPDPGSGVKGCFSECDEVMLAAIDDIENALDSIKSQNFVKANFDISAVLTNVDTCEDCFAESVGGDAEAKKLLAQVQKLTGEALDSLQTTQPPG